MQPIKNILFDLGGIFMNLDFKLTEQAFINHGIKEFPGMFTRHHANDLFEQLETGRITPGEFYERFRLATNSSLSNEQIKGAWNALLLDFPAERLQWLDAIRQKYNVYLFSNTNQVHYEAVMETLQKENGEYDFNRYFIKAYYSHELGLRKPYIESFLKIMEEQQLVAAETLFIDDTLQNIEGARKAGLQTIHLVAPKTVLDLDL